VTYALQVGGLETYIDTLATQFLALGYEAHIIETVSKGNQSDYFREKGFNVQTILISMLESQYNFALRLANELNTYDVLILNHVPFVHSLLGLLNRNVIVLPILHNDIAAFYDEVMLNNSQWNKIICVSPALEIVLKEKMVLKDEKKAITILNGVHVIPSCIKKIEKLRSKSNFELVYVGRIEDTQKGVLLLPEIIKKVIANNSNILLKIIGDGPSFELLQKEIIRLDLKNQIQLLGKKTHYEALTEIHNADALIMPSYYEGLGLVYLEAMAQATVPIVSNLKNNTNLLISHEKNGYLCTIGDIDCFAKSIAKLAGDRDLLRSMSYEAWKIASDTLSDDIMVRKYLEIISYCRNNNEIKRSNKIDRTLLGDLPYSPNILVRPIRKVLRLLGLWRKQ
jgi:glycosyltransferase involved in cell wall biosynthesis